MITKKQRLIHRLVIAVVFICLCISLGLSIYIHSEIRHIGDRVYPNVIIDGLDMGKKTRNEALKLYDDNNKQIQEKSVLITYKNEIVSTFSGQMIGLHYNIGEIYDRAYTIGRSPNFSSRWFQRFATIFGLKRFVFNTELQYNKNPLRDFVQFMEESYNKLPQNALFTFENNRVTSFRKEKNGLQIESKIFFDNFDRVIKTITQGISPVTVELKSRIVKPEITLGQANDFGIEELIGEGVSNYSHSIAGRIHNVILASSKFNGVLIPKGREFSFNETLGDVSAQTGYQQAYIIKSGKTVLGDGGGICQVSSTFFRAALNAGLPIIEHHYHAYRVSYYENGSKAGLDATVYAPSVDLKVKNDTPSDILIQTEIDKENMILTIRFYGKKDGRVAEMTTPALYDVSPPPSDLMQDDPTLKKGEIKQVDFAAWGGKAKFEYKVTKNGEILFSKKFYASYKPWQAVYLVGTAD